MTTHQRSVLAGTTHNERVPTEELPVLGTRPQPGRGLCLSLLPVTLARDSGLGKEPPPGAHVAITPSTRGHLGPARRFGWWWRGPWFNVAFPSFRETLVHTRSLRHVHKPAEPQGLPHSRAEDTSTDHRTRQSPGRGAS